jgi:hypothetical protein
MARNMVPEKTIFTIADEERIIKKDALPKSRLLKNRKSGRLGQD